MNSITYVLLLVLVGLLIMEVKSKKRRHTSSISGDDGKIITMTVFLI